MSEQPGTSIAGTRPLDWVSSRPDVASRLRREPPDRVLVLGCRDGADALDLAQAFPNLTVYGIDSDAAAVGQAQESGRLSPARDRVMFLHDDEIDPRLSLTFDVVVAVGVLTDRARRRESRAADIGVNQMLWLIARLLNPNGLALLDSPVPLDPGTAGEAGFASVDGVGDSVHGCHAYLLRR